MKEGTHEETPKTIRSVSRMNRRELLDYLLGTVGGATLLSLLYPVLRFIVPPASAASAETSVVVAKANEVPASSGRVFKFGDKPALLIRDGDGSFKALSAVCTHLECTVQYRAESNSIWCACHNGQYNLNGQNIGGPPPRPLGEYSVTVRGDDIVVTKG